MDLNWILDMLTSPYMSLFFLFFIGYFCWHNVYDYNDLADCSIALGTNKATIFIPNRQDINENLTIFSNITLRIIQGGTLNIGKYSIRNATYKWTVSPAQAGEYYLELSGGGDPGIIEPPKIWEDGVMMLRGTLGSLVIGEWNWGDNDTLGYDTVYVSIAGDADPDGKAVDYVEAGYKVTVKGNLCAGPYQIIEGYGDIDLTYTMTKEVHPEWWGYGSQTEYYKSLNIPKTIFTEMLQLLSPDTDCHQGYSTDGIFHYCTHTNALYKKNDDAAWTNAAANADPFAGGQPQDHLGDCDYHDGKLYVGACTEGAVYCDDHANEAIYVFDADDLTRLAIHDISAQNFDPAGLVVVPEHGRNGIIYVASHCNRMQILKYDLSDFSYLGVIDLDVPTTAISSVTIPSLQGITYKNGYFYLACEGGNLYVADLDGHVSLIFQETTVATHEGIDYSQDDLRWLIEVGAVQKVHFFRPSKNNEQGIKLNELGVVRGRFSNLVKVMTYLADADQEDIAHDTLTKVELNAKEYDPEGYFDSAVNYRFTAPCPGFYQVNASIRYANVVADKRYDCVVRRNGFTRITGIAHTALVHDLTVGASQRIYLAEGDYVELWAYHTAGVGTVDILKDINNTFMSIFLEST